MVGPSSQADPYLYKSALEYHILPNNFNGPQDQIKIRKYYFDFITKSPYMVIKHGPKGTLISNKQTKLCYCFADIYPTESTPVRFKVYLKCFGEIRLLVGYQFLNEYARIPVRRLPLHEEVDGCIIVKENHLWIRVGNERARILLEGFAISFGVGMESKAGEVQITKM